MPETGTVTTDITDHISTITFHHPKGNSMPSALLRQLNRAISAVSNDDSARIIVIRSKGDGAFCAGASFDELMEISDYEEGKQFFMGFARVINAMRKCPKLIIARVQGKAVGGGVGLAAAADHTLAHRSADIKLSELSIGIGPFVVGPAVRRKIGDAGFSTLTIDATHWYNAEWARNNGLYAHLFDTHEALDGAVDELAANLAEYNPEAMRELKNIFWEGTDHWDTLLEERAAISGRLVLSEHTQKFINTFKQNNQRD